MTETPDRPADDQPPPDLPPIDPRPAPVRYAFVLWLLAGLFSIVNAIYLFTTKQDLIDVSVRLNPDVPYDQIARGANTLLWMFMIGAVAFAALFALFAYKAQDGTRRARLMLTMLCTLTVLFYFLILNTLFGLMTALLAIIATVLLYLPKSNFYFRPAELPT
ncbi:MAG TPA: hypothetical protein VFV67_04165 [Actinophytocola sp.]|uniref:hypothetical protein n=1 Tax=Actinophytocola sp. TaxID=1872138 RepID=UPI002DBD8AB8|nr:hypothetical protein [Actinophytocola sp.]HEU5469823.1 hypothetical protein [Actinophytocola sp.]